MTTPAVPLAEFLQCVERSRLLDRAHLQRVLPRVRPRSARDMADALIEAGDLTHYQAQKLLRGRWAGLTLGPYRLLAPIGRGGMGTVFLAQNSIAIPDGWDAGLVALKVLPPRLARSEPRALLRFRREIAVSRWVAHPNVVRTVAGGECEGVHFLVLEYVPGLTVQKLVATTGVMAVGDAARVFAEVAEGLAHIHQRGLIHRDLKPANVIVTPAGHAKILDLGLALIRGEPPAADPALVGGKGYIVGTMDYIAPEQARDAIAIDVRADLYSLGCSLYFALTGSPPFPGGTAHEKIRKQRKAEPPSLASLNPTVPMEFSLLIERLMAKNPALRPANAAETRELLMPFATPAVPVAPTSRNAAVALVDSPEVDLDLWEGEEEGQGQGASVAPRAGLLRFAIPVGVGLLLGIGYAVWRMF